VTRPPATRDPRRIVAPVTFAHDSVEAVAVAADLAAALDAELVLAGIAPMAPPELTQSTPDVGTFQWRAEEQRLLDQLMSTHLEELTDAIPDDVRCRTVLTWGSIGPALVEVAQHEAADLVVVPIRREGELAHVAHDHVDRYVLHHSEVPVIVVPTNGHRATHRR
jgi:nucleotide-binding universal stress UspA family protein